LAKRGASDPFAVPPPLLGAKPVPASSTWVREWQTGWCAPPPPLLRPHCPDNSGSRPAVSVHSIDGVGPRPRDGQESPDRHGERPSAPAVTEGGQHSKHSLPLLEMRRPVQGHPACLDPADSPIDHLPQGYLRVTEQVMGTGSVGQEGARLLLVDKHRFFP